MSGGRRSVKINVPVLARVEGEGALDLEIADGAIRDLRLRIFEPPRLFEKFLEGRGYDEVPDMVARICGICPVAYQMSAVHAIEGVFGVQPGPWVRAMRRLFYCGEWIESHALHIHLLAAPDFLGYSSAPEMARQYAAEVRRGLRLQALGNDIIRLLGARSVHPLGACVGGFYHAPDAAAVAQLRERIEAALPDAADLVRWTASLSLPAGEQSFVSVALRHEDEYPMNEGRLVSSAGLDIAIEEFEQHFEERHVPHSTALHCLLHGEDYLVGPLARLNLNLDRLPAPVREAAQATGIRWPSANPFHGIVARAVEILYALHEARRLLGGYEVPAAPRSQVHPAAGTGYGCTEAPRGILWHRYSLDTAGRVTEARIVPPTSQNQARIEADLRAALSAFGLDRPDDTLRAHAETVIRNYDPCISCATHFLRLNVQRGRA
jgi:sulfhydrogenase subunit alpha